MHGAELMAICEHWHFGTLLCVLRVWPEEAASGGQEQRCNELMKARGIAGSAGARGQYPRPVPEAGQYLRQASTLRPVPEAST